jgi:hypothetical protein
LPRVLLAALVALLALAPGGLAVTVGGHNPPTRKLETAFKVMGGARARAHDGCYPEVRRAVKLIEFWSVFDVGISRGLSGVDRPNVVYIIRKRTGCNRMLMALRDRGRLYLLDTGKGEVYVHGQRPDRSGENPRGGRGPLRALSLVTRTFRLEKEPNESERLIVRCPRRSFPMGGGLVSNPPPGPDGEGVYPHSYERLGVQRGYHVTTVFIDPSPKRTTARRATLQVVCARGLVPHSSPHKTVFVRRNGAATATARCPRGEYLFSGGFQRTNFATPFLEFGGNYATESRAIDSQTWRVTGHAAGRDGGELTAIAYCVKSSGPLLAEVVASTPVPAGRFAIATTPACPEGHALTAGGFSFNGSRNGFFADGSISADGTWSASAFGYFGPIETLTAHGYCLEIPDV